MKTAKTFFLLKFLNPTSLAYFPAPLQKINRGLLLSGCCFCMLSPSHGHEGLLPVTNPTVICVFELLVGTSDICCTASAETLKAAAQHFSAQWLSNLFCLIAHTSLLRKWMVKTFRAEWFRALAVSLQIIHRETAYSNLFFILIK